VAGAASVAESMINASGEPDAALLAASVLPHEKPLPLALTLINQG
jgi:hypothetical protein